MLKVEYSCPSCTTQSFLGSYLLGHLLSSFFELVDYWLVQRTESIEWPSILAFKHSHKLLRGLGWVGFRLTLHEIRKHDRLHCPFSRVPRQFSSQISCHTVEVWQFGACDINTSVRLQASEFVTSSVRNRMWKSSWQWVKVCRTMILCSFKM